MLCFVALFLLVAIIVPAVSAQGNPPRLVPYTITTVAGGAVAPTQGTSGYSGGSLCGAPWPASNTGLTGPNPDGSWPTPPFDPIGDGCLANQASLNTTRYAIPDPFGTLWILDTGNGLSTDIRFVNPLTGIITAYNYGNVKGPNDNSPRGIAFDIAGNAYYMGENKSKGWKVDYVTGALSQIAGNTNGGSGCSGDNVPALGDAIDNPSGVAIDALGNAYFVDNKCFRVRRIDPSGTMWEIIGVGAGVCTSTGVAGTTGLNTPYAVAVDPYGNLYVANQTCYTLMEVLVDPTTINANGVGWVTKNSTVLTLAGTGANPSGFTYPQMCYGNLPCGLGPTMPIEPAGVQVDPEGPVKDSNGKLGYNLFVQEGSHVWYWDFATKWLRRIAGGNANCSWAVDSLGDGCPASNSNMATAYGVDVDALGNVYVGDDADNVVRKIFRGAQLSDGSALWLNAPVVSEYAALDKAGPFAGAVIAEAHFEPGDSAAATNPFQVFGDFSLAANAIDMSGTSQVNPYCIQNTSGDSSWDCIFSIDYNATRVGTVTAPLTVTGTATSTPVDYSALGVVNQPAIVLDPGVVTVLPASVSNPGEVAVDSLGNWYVADTGNNRILKNGQVLVSGLNAPQGVAVDGAGNVYIADTGNNVVKEWHAATQTVTVAAGGGTPCSVTSWTFISDSLGNNCLATQATLNHPTALAVDSLLNLYILDQGNVEVRRLDPKKHTITLVAGGGGASVSECTLSSTHPRCATLTSPVALAVGAPGLVFVVEGGSTNDIKEINLLTLPATINTVATYLSTTSPSGVGVDAAGNLYYADAGYQVVGMASAVTAYLTHPPPSAIPQLVLGIAGITGDTAVASGSLANTIALNGPGALALDPSGNVYVADVNNDRILKVDRSQSAIQFNSVAPGQLVAWSNITATNSGTQALTLSSLSITGANAIDFTIDSQTTCGTASLAPGTSCEVIADAEPTDSGALSAAISLAGNAVNTPVIQLVADGTGTPTSASLNFNPAIQSFGTASTMTATVTPASCTGNVSFTVDGDLVGSVALNGSGAASQQFPWKNHFLLICGNMTVQALYTDPSGVCSDSQAVQSLAIQGSQTTTTLAESGGSSAGGVMTIAQYQPVNLTAQITSQAQGSETGTVQFWAKLPIGDQLLNTLEVPQEGSSQIAPPSTTTLSSAGTAIYLTQWLPPGTYQIYAKYMGDCHFDASTSSVVTVTVTPVTWNYALSLPVGAPAATQNGPEGSIATATIILTPLNYPGVPGTSLATTLAGTTTVKFSCIGTLPAYSDCTFGPGNNPVTLDSVFVDANSPALFHCSNNTDQYPPCKIQMDLITNLASIASLSEPKAKGHSQGLPLLAALALMCPGLVLVGAGLRGELRSRKGLCRKLFFLMGMMLLLGVLLGLPGCGGTLHKVNAVTPPGTYSITVQGQMVMPDGSMLTKTVQVPIVVTPLSQ